MSGEQTTTAEDRSGEIFNSPERAAKIISESRKLIEQANAQDAIHPYSRKIHRVEHGFDPIARDPENGRPGGAIVEKRVSVQAGEDLVSSDWRTFVSDAPESPSFRWAIVSPKDNPYAKPMIELETPVDLGPTLGTGAAKAGVVVEGRRIQQFIPDPETGSVNVRTADFSFGGGEYRVIPGRQSTDLATEAQVAFIEQNFGNSELVQVNGNRTGIRAQEIAPELSQAA